ncbi:hypothetical protein ACFSL4_25680, partial [Streptomyces caeni]
MRCRARVLSAAALAAAALGTVAPPASADPSADVSPRRAAPGDTVAVRASCDAAGGTPTESIHATFRGFERGTARLRRYGGGAGASAAVYSGTDRIAADPGTGGGSGAAGFVSQRGVEGRCPAAFGGETPWAASFTVSRDDAGREGEGQGREQGGGGQGEQPGREQGGGGQGEQPGREQGGGGQG